jgi:hypothetical protein
MRLFSVDFVLGAGRHFGEYIGILKPKGGCSIVTVYR